MVFSAIIIDNQYFSLLLRDQMDQKKVGCLTATISGDITQSKRELTFRIVPFYAILLIAQNVVFATC